MDIRGKNFLIVGGASLAGSHIADALLAAGAAEVRCLDNLSLGSLGAIAHLTTPRVKIIRGDMLRLNELIDATTGVDGVFLVAAYLAGPLNANMAVGLEVNTTGVRNVLDACRFTGVRRLVYSSSVGVYGNAVELEQIDETTPYISAGVSAVMAVYSGTKIVGEGLCRFYAEKYGLGCNALRYSSIYGPRQHSHSINALPVVEMYEAIKAGRRPTIYGDGNEVHDYLYVEDLAEANVKAMTSDAVGEFATVASGVARSINDIAAALLRVTKSDLVPEHRESGARLKFTSSNRLNYSVAKAERVFGWKPKTSLEEGIRRYVAWREQSA